MKIAFIVDRFPVVSETFVINQVADLMDRGIEVEIYSFHKGDKENISQRYHTYNMAELVHYLDTPKNIVTRLRSAIPKIAHVFVTHPLLLFKIFNIRRYRRKALSLSLLFWIEPFLDKKFDLAHCHFGTVANNYLSIKKILGLRQKIVTTFYGYDASRIFNENRSDYYAELKEESTLFFAMSHNMKERLVAQGFEKNKIKVLPVSIDLQSYPYKERTPHDGEPVNIISVGRFVEKKGFDDLLRALAIVKEKSKKAFKCYIIGDGVMKDELFALTDQLKLKDIVEYKGFMNMEAIITFFMGMHVFVQPSKTARNGDME